MVMRSRLGGPRWRAVAVGLAVCTIAGVSGCLPRAKRVDALLVDAADEPAGETSLDVPVALDGAVSEVATPDVGGARDADEAGLDAALRDEGPDTVARDEGADTAQPDAGFDATVNDVEASSDAADVADVTTPPARCPVPPRLGEAPGSVRPMADVHARMQFDVSLHVKSAVPRAGGRYFVLGQIFNCATCVPGTPCVATEVGRGDFGVVAVDPDNSASTPLFDSAFNGGAFSHPGAACHDVEGGAQVPLSMRSDAAGRLLVGGLSYVGELYSAVVLRMRGTSGTGAGAELDPSFGDRGTVNLSSVLGPRNTAVFSVWPLSDGGVLVAGANGNEGSPAGFGFLAKLTSDGELDPSFGVGASGVVIENNALGFYSSAIDTTGAAPRVVALGRSPVANHYRLFRYDLARGTLDTTFAGGAGFVDVNVGGEANPRSVLVAHGGYYVLGARNRAADGYNAAAVAARVFADGRVDASFGGPPVGSSPAGVLRCEGTIWNYGYQFESAAAVGCDGWVYVTGISVSGAAVRVQRFDARGVIDPSYGDSGTVVLASGVSVPTEPRGDAISPVAALVDPTDGALTVVMGGGHNNGAYLVRLNP